MRPPSWIPVVLILFATAASAQVPPRAAQIALAVQAAPADRRDAAKVYGYGEDGSFITLREGTNDMICLADDPATEGIEVNCYHASLEPFMARGRALTAEGVEGAERTRVRYQEIEAGTLKMPGQPAILYTMNATSWDPAAGTVTGEYRRQTIYIPYATAESTGLSTQASDAAPWIMFPGTPGAHIMITPPRRAGG